MTISRVARRVICGAGRPPGTEQSLVQPTEFTFLVRELGGPRSIYFPAFERACRRVAGALATGEHARA